MKRLALRTSIILLFIFSFLSQPLSVQAINIKTYQYHKAIQRLLNKQKTVNLGIIIDSVSTSFTGDWVPNWCKTLQGTLVVDLQNSVLRYSGFTDYEYFGLIDRSGIEALLKEINFQQTGYLTVNDRTKLGELLGLTHILFETYSRFPASSPYSMQDQADFRLVEVKTGRVLATDTVISKNHATEDRWTPWEFKNASKKKK